MEEQEKFDIINRRLTSMPDNWRWKSDSKMFGWGSYRRNRRRIKALKFISFIRHKISKGLPLTDEEIAKSKWYPQIKKLVIWYLSNNLNNK